MSAWLVIGLIGLGVLNIVIGAFILANLDGLGIMIAYLVEDNDAGKYTCSSCGEQYAIGVPCDLCDGGVGASKESQK